jgi:hypothetical protein
MLPFRVVTVFNNGAYGCDIALPNLFLRGLFLMILFFSTWTAFTHNMFFLANMKVNPGGPGAADWFTGILLVWERS